MVLDTNINKKIEVQSSTQYNSNTKIITFTDSLRDISKNIDLGPIPNLQQ